MDERFTRILFVSYLIAALILALLSGIKVFGMTVALLGAVVLLYKAVRQLWAFTLALAEVRRPDVADIFAKDLAIRLQAMRIAAPDEAEVLQALAEDLRKLPGWAQLAIWLLRANWGVSRVEQVLLAITMLASQEVDPSGYTLQHRQILQKLADAVKGARQKAGAAARQKAKKTGDGSDHL